MLHAERALTLAFCLVLGACRAAPQNGAGTDSPVPRSGVESLQSLQRQTGRPLQGRFLHITDFHPDPSYKVYSSTESDAACHRKRGPAGLYGAETSGCDSPISLVNETFKWINDNLRDQIDFVVWTGDSARHDNDEQLPRTQKQVIAQNELVVAKFTEIFATSNTADDAHATQKLSIPIVPTFGNNDIMPHNIFLDGPNKWTTKYLDIWKNFIPEAQRHQFQQGGWFYVEVIPGELAVISLNTLYFFDSNSAVDGCAAKHEPGYEHMEWLRIQLTALRDRGMKAILAGHVGPARTNSKSSWDETCWQKFTLVQRQFRDILVGSLFGHMNIDHFMLHDFHDIKKDTKKGRMARNIEARASMLEDGEVTVASAASYLLDLGNEWAKLPLPPKPKNPSAIAENIDADEEDESPLWQWVINKISMLRKREKKRKAGPGGKGNEKNFLDKIGGRYGERFSVAHVSPSIVPNYFPTLRVFSYNITGLENTLLYPIYTSPSDRNHLPGSQLPIDYMDFSDDEDWVQDVKAIVEIKRKEKEVEARKKKTRKYKFTIPPPPSKSAPPGPAYSPQTLTLEGYVQYFANLTHINNDFVAQALSLDQSDNDNDVFGLEFEDGQVEQNKWREGKHKNHQGKKPKNKPHPKKFKFQVEYNTTHDKFYRLNDLTVRSYIDLARKIGRDKKGKKILSVEEYDALEQDFEDETTYDEEGYSFDEDEDKHEDEDSDSGVDMEKTKKKKKKKKGKSKHDGPWFTFIRRAFVGTMDPHEIEEAFGSQDVKVGEAAREEVVMEL